MARVSFSALVEEIVGKLAGSVFQDSYGGYQIRTRVSPKNPQSYYQQLRRGEFAYISSLWRTLTAEQRQTFYDAAASPSGGFDLFVSCNINASLIGVDLISSYTPSDPPAAFPLAIVELSPPVFTVIANSELTEVPDGFSLLLYATTEKAPTKIFTNPSQYQPIAFFSAGYHFSDPVDIAPYWIEHYGQFTQDKRICLKTVLIKNDNGLRGEENIVCATESAPETYFVIDSDENILWDGTDQIIYQ